MPKKKAAEETPEVVEKPTIEDVVAEAHLARDDAEKEAAAAEQKAQEAAENPKPEIDLDAEREKTKQETREQIEKEVVDPIKEELKALRETITPEEKDEYEKFVEDARKADPDKPEWKIYMDFAKETYRKEQEEAKKAAEAAEKQQAAEQETQANQNWQVWKGQMEDLESRDLLPKMKEPKEGDPGFDARLKLYGFMQATWKTGQPSMNLYEVYMRFSDQLRTKNEQPAGADAPVSIGQTAGGGAEDKEVRYEDIHRGGQDLESFMMSEAKKAGLA